MPTIGAQTIIFNKTHNMETEADLVLSALKKAGYEAVESGMKDMAVFKQKLDAHGLKHAASHAGPRAICEKTQTLIDDLKLTGATDMCNSGLWDWHARTFADVGYTIKMLNEGGKKLRDAGIKCHYHNHDFEFQVTILGKRIIDILVDELDPACWDLCVDVAWVLRGGDNPADYLAKHAGRIGYLHFKDFDGTRWVPVGQGKVDFKSILPVLPQLKMVHWIMVEQDQPAGDPIQDMAQSRQYLASIGL